MRFFRSKSSKPVNSAPLRVFITGASSGIGMTLARQYAKRGAKIGLVARRAELLNRLAAELGSCCTTYCVDVRDAAQMRAAAQDFMHRHQGIDIVIANAGIARGSIHTIMETNLIGMVNTFQPFIKTMKHQGHGQLVGICSVAGIRGIPGASGYSASKAAAINYLEGLRCELHRHGIRVNTIIPGYIRTPITSVIRHRLPFLADVDDACAKFIRAIDKNQRLMVFPWQMAILTKFMAVLPAHTWEKITTLAPKNTKFWENDY